MRKITQPFARKAMIAAASFAIAGGALCTYVARADDMKTDAKTAESKMESMTSDNTPMTADETKMVTDRIDKMKTMAADPGQAETMEKDMAKMMVMDHMAKMIAEDSTTKQAVMDLMGDENMKKVHEQAMKMAKDPAEMKKMQDEIEADPTEMKRVDHEAIMMAMHHDKSGKSDMMDKMEDKMNK